MKSHQASLELNWTSVRRQKEAEWTQDTRNGPTRLEEVAGGSDRGVQPLQVKQQIYYIGGYN